MFRLISFSGVESRNSGMVTCWSVPLNDVRMVNDLLISFSDGSKQLSSLGVMVNSLMSPENASVPGVKPCSSSL